MKRFKGPVAALAVAMIGVFALAPVATVGAIDPLAEVCSTSSDSQICDTHKTGDDDAASLIQSIVNVLLFIVGLLSVVMIIVSGILYTVSSGDTGKVTKAKNTLTYSIVGLIVAFLAYAIVNWVLDVL